jgi:ribose 5-phosphate isomerase B
MSREHNDANILCLGARVVDFPKAQEIVDAWLNASFQGGRHESRLKKIKNIELVRKN